VFECAYPSEDELDIVVPPVVDVPDVKSPEVVEFPVVLVDKNTEPEVLDVLITQSPHAE
jgi:hypothetical protein